MDNLQTTAPAGAESTIASTDNAQVETQPVETEAIGTNGQEETGQAPWEADPKFKGKTPDEIYKSYKELEKGYGQLSQKAQVANLIEEKYGVAPDELKSLIEQQAQEEQERLYRENPVAAVAQQVESLEAKLAYQETEKELDTFLQENPEYSKFKDKILNLGLTVHKDLGFDEIARDYFGEAIAQGQQSAYQKIDSKIKTQSTPPTSAEQKQGGYKALQDLPRADRIKAFESMLGA